MIERKKASATINRKFQIIVTSPPPPFHSPLHLKDNISYKKKFRSEYSILYLLCLTFPTEGFKASHSTFPDLRINVLTTYCFAILINIMIEVTKRCTHFKCVRGGKACTKIAIVFNTCQETRTDNKMFGLDKLIKGNMKIVSQI